MIVATLAVTIGCNATQSNSVQVSGVPAYREVMRGDIYYDCDTTAGHTSQWSRTIDPTGSATGTLFIKELRHDDKLPPFGGVLVGGPAIDNPVGITVTLDRSRTSLLAEVRYPKRGPATGRARLELGRAPTSGIQFALQWEGNKLQMRVDPATPWTDVHLPFKPERLWLVCATSTVVFHSITVTTPSASGVTTPKEQTADKPETAI